MTFLLLLLSVALAWWGYAVNHWVSERTFGRKNQCGLEEFSSHGEYVRKIVLEHFAGVLGTLLLLGGAVTFIIFVLRVSVWAVKL